MALIHSRGIIPGAVAVCNLFYVNLCEEVVKQKYRVEKMYTVSMRILIGLLLLAIISALIILEAPKCERPCQHAESNQAYLSNEAFVPASHHDLNNTHEFFFAIPVQIKKVVFILDYTGSNSDMMPYMLQQFKDSVRDLNPRGIHFTVIGFGMDGKTFELSNEELTQGMKKASAKNKRKIFSAISAYSKTNAYVPFGYGNAEAAFKLAVKYEPNEIIFLTHDIYAKGKTPLNPKKLYAILDPLAKKMKDKPYGFKMRCIQFGTKMNSAYEMRRLAKRYSGMAKMIYDREKVIVHSLNY